jgi:2-keto-4-pentenoate hydratase/2-oxohepta-3-ene-1,7-dioic acid hydratase in catechol pathway
VLPPESSHVDAEAELAIVIGSENRRMVEAEPLDVVAGYTLLPGGLIPTGTPAGVGVHRDPPVALADGDVAEIEIPLGEHPRWRDEGSSRNTERGCT